MSSHKLTTFNSIPIELRELIANRLDSEDVYAFSATSKANYTASTLGISKHRTEILGFLNDIKVHHKALMTLIDPNSLCVASTMITEHGDYFSRLYADKFYESYQDLIEVINDDPGVNISTLLTIWGQIRHDKRIEVNHRFPGEWASDDDDSSDY